ncbi:hypothetical protein SESBI_11139 [Sesbania bispinosa]|nr:hypothetical protein SESBI_11139 [Sesbania bispinosa]
MASFFTVKPPTPSLSRRFLSNKPTISCSFSLKCKREYTSVMIVPTGIGAAIGGYAGDALPVARALSTVVDCLITHPNVPIQIHSLLSYLFNLRII